MRPWQPGRDNPALVPQYCLCLYSPETAKSFMKLSVNWYIMKPASLVQRRRSHSAVSASLLCGRGTAAQCVHTRMMHRSCHCKDYHSIRRMDRSVGSGGSGDGITDRPTTDAPAQIKLFELTARDALRWWRLPRRVISSMRNDDATKVATSELFWALKHFRNEM